MRRAFLPVLLAFALALGACKKPAPPPSPEEVPRATAPEKVEPTPRCASLAAGPAFVLGPADIGRATTSNRDGGELAPDEMIPFASEVGDGIAWNGGFAVGAIHEADSVLAMSVVTLGADGQNPKITSLGTAHGDVEPPRLAARGETLVAGVLQPEPNGRALRLAKIDSGKVLWGATVHEKSDESQAFDLALGEKKGIVVWDEDGPTSGVIQVSTFDVATIGNATPPRTISPATADAESPRLVTRPGGGYWLSYIARGSNDVDSDARYLAEEIGFRWIEIVSLDANGSPTSAARAVTAKDGHVMVFDVAATAEGGEVLVFRYDDTPSGSSGGAVMRVLVHPSAVEPPVVLVDEDVGAGAPSLLDGWLAVMDAADQTRLSPINGAGEMTAPLSTEPEIGTGEPIAVGPGGMLVARPAGRAVKLVVLRCTPPALGDL